MRWRSCKDLFKREEVICSRVLFFWDLSHSLFLLATTDVDLRLAFLGPSTAALCGTGFYSADIVA